MPITFRYYEKPEDLKLQYDFWTEITAKLPYAWKPTLSPKQYINQKEFHPNSRCFAFNGEKIVGYMSFTGAGDFVSLGYPWVLPEYEGDLQDELFDRIYKFAVSEEYGGKKLAQRFRSQWQAPIDYFLSKGFMISNRSPIVGVKLSESVNQIVDSSNFTYQISEGFQFDRWKCVTIANQEVSAKQLEMIETYYGSVAFDFSLECTKEDKTIGYFGVTIRSDTRYSEIIATGINSKFNEYYSEMIQIILQECLKRGVETVSIAQSHLTSFDSLDQLGFTPITEDVMLIKESD
ncbi:hypothetical protein ACFVR1_17440 [Psychrobacillus sp. NPDC058041]|uniref:hypothetical protein n=1 Tax=Psychrobacillus sp. NPDC058041 TaxID=3346310 RepID=UPI0036DC79CC